MPSLHQPKASTKDTDHSPPLQVSVSRALLNSVMRLSADSSAWPKRPFLEDPHLYFSESAVSAPSDVNTFHLYQNIIYYSPKHDLWLHIIMVRVGKMIRGYLIEHLTMCLVEFWTMLSILIFPKAHKRNTMIPILQIRNLELGEDKERTRIWTQAGWLYTLDLSRFVLDLAVVR